MPRATLSSLIAVSIVLMTAAAIGAELRPDLLSPAADLARRVDSAAIRADSLPAAHLAQAGTPQRKSAHGSSPDSERAGRAQGDSAGSTEALKQRAFIAYRTGHIPEAQALYVRAADRGDAAARYNAAVIRLRDESITPSQATALAWLRRSAQAGFAPAQYMLGGLLDNGHMLPMDRAQASDWYRRAALQGHPDAALALGTLYFVGSGVPQDDAQAARWYGQAAEAGDVGAQYLIASFYEHGHGVTRDLDLALRWYTEAARQGDDAAIEKAREITRTLARERQS